METGVLITLDLVDRHSDASSYIVQPVVEEREKEQAASCAQLKGGEDWKEAPWIANSAGRCMRVDGCGGGRVSSMRLK